MKKLLTYLSILLLSVTLFSCNKKYDDIPEPTNDKLIQVKVRTENLIERSLLKSVDMNNWVYNYNSGQYNLVFTGQHNTYTFSKSIQELQTGFQVSITPDTYIITYNSEHYANAPNAPLANNLDITISEEKTIYNSSELVLNAHHSDFLIVLDNGGRNAVMVYQGAYNITNLFRVNNEYNELMFMYGYYNVEGDIQIRYQNDQGQYLISTITNAKINNVYHIVKGINGTASINIVPFSFNVVAW